MTRSLAELLVGRTLADRYRVEALIGEGGMSLVYRGVDERLGRPVAIKVVSLPADAGDQRAELRERFRREAGSAARIPPHPNVVQVYDYGTDQALDLDFIAMELLRGRDLKAALREDGAPSPAEAMRILLEAARGLAAGHRAGIVHRDVKPANLFLVGSGRMELVKILDFGIAKALEVEPDQDLTRAGQLPQSPAYASPEQTDPGREVGPASDVFQLGLVAYETLAGERPFEPDQRERLRRGDSIALPARGRWPEVAPAVREVVATALRPLPGDRYPDAAAFAEALAAAAEPVAEPGMVFAPAAPAPPAEDEADVTVLAPAHPLPEAPPPPPASAPQRPPAARGSGLRRWAPAGVAVVALLALWMLIRGDDPAGAPEPAMAAADLAALDEEFQPLLLQAHRNLREASSAEQGERASEEVLRVIEDLNRAWVTGELDRHLAHYADRVDFYRADGASRERIRRERREALERFPEREIVIERSAINFPEPGRAVALVDKSWDFGGGEESWSGAVRQELILEREDGRWRVVSERDLEVYRQDRSPG